MGALHQLPTLMKLGTRRRITFTNEFAAEEDMEIGQIVEAM